MSGTGGFWTGDRVDFEDRLHEIVEEAGDAALIEVKLDQDQARITYRYDNLALEDWRWLL